MNTVDFFGHQVSKLIVGDNPISGHSYITAVLKDCTKRLVLCTTDLGNWVLNMG